MSETPITPADIDGGSKTLGQVFACIVIAVCCFAAGFSFLERSKD